MRRFALLALLACLLAPAPVPAPAVADQPSAARWRADVRDEMRGSLGYLERRAAGSARLAVNLDIDNTMLATEYASGDPVRPVLRLARRAHELGVRVFVNTARPAHRRAETRAELARAGYLIDGLCMRRRGESTRSSKPRCRERFRTRGPGWSLVVNVGNNRTDFAGGGYGRAYRLPNYGGALT